MKRTKADALKTEWVRQVLATPHDQKAIDAAATRFAEAIEATDDKSPDSPAGHAAKLIHGITHLRDGHVEGYDLNDAIANEEKFFRELLKAKLPQMDERVADSLKFDKNGLASISLRNFDAQEYLHEILPLVPTLAAVEIRMVGGKNHGVDEGKEPIPSESYNNALLRQLASDMPPQINILRLSEDPSSKQLLNHHWDAAPEYIRSFTRSMSRHGDLIGLEIDHSHNGNDWADAVANARASRSLLRLALSNSWLDAQTIGGAISFDAYNQQSPHMAKLLTSPHLEELRELDLHGGSMGKEAETVMRTAKFPHLRVLVLPQLDAYRRASPLPGVMGLDSDLTPSWAGSIEHIVLSSPIDLEPTSLGRAQPIDTLRHMIGGSPSLSDYDKLRSISYTSGSHRHYIADSAMLDDWRENGYIPSSPEDEVTVNDTRRSREELKRTPPKPR